MSDKKALFSQAGATCTREEGQEKANRDHSPGFVTTVDGAGSAPGFPWMASKTSCRCTGTSLGATMPSRTLSPRISTTVTVMSLLITMLSFFFLDNTNIAAYPFSSSRNLGVKGRLPRMLGGTQQ